MNRAVARCWQACSPDKRPILSHRQMTHRQAPKTKQTCLGFGQGLPESQPSEPSAAPRRKASRYIPAVPGLGQSRIAPPVPFDSRSRSDGAPSGRGQWCLMRWPGKGTDGGGGPGGAGLARARTGGAGGGARAVAGARGGGRRDDGGDTGAAWCYYPERALFVSFRPTAPDFGGRSALGLTLSPSAR